MGCCYSSSYRRHTTEPGPANKDASIKPSPIPSLEDGSRSPPPLEEEAVKEVLPETAIRIPSTVIRPSWFPHRLQEQEEKPDLQKPPTSSAAAPLVLPRGNVLLMVPPTGPVLHNDEKMPEQAEIWNVSESFSTTTISDKRQQERDCCGEVEMPKAAEENPTWTSLSSPAKSRRNRPSPCSGRGGESDTWSSGSRRERGGVRRHVPEPPSRSPWGSRGAGGQMTVRRNPFAAPGSSLVPSRTTDPEANPGPRSRSPAMRRSEQGGGSSSTGRSPQKAPPLPAAATQGDWRKSDREGDDGPTLGESETLDNPLVSLECFIFL